MKKRLVFKNNHQRVFNLVTAGKFLALAVIFVFAILPAIALAQFGLEYGTLTGLGSEDLRVTIMKIVRIVLGLVGIIAIIIIIYAGYIWMTSAGNAEKIDYAKRTLRNAAIGLLIIFLAFAIVSFIINALIEATGGRRPGGGPGTGCENCGHLGRGIIQSVYPEPFARDVARNTIIMVTFKVPMDPSTIVEGCTAAGPACVGNLVDDNVKIFPQGQDEEATKLLSNQVVARSEDGKTFVFDPVDYLGDGINNIWYSTKLTNDILRDNGDPAFPGVNDYFSWQFEIGTYLDLDPVEVENVFPAPDAEADDYDLSEAAKAIGSITVLSQPRVGTTAQVGTVINEIPGGTNILNISGTYNCGLDALICISHPDSPGGSLAIQAREADAADCSSGSVIAVSGLQSSAALTSGAANIGCGLTARFIGTVPNGNPRWRFQATSGKTADTLRADTKTYTFVASNPGSSQIAVGATLPDTAAAIATKINGDNLRLAALPVTNSVVNLEAVLAGERGNTISLQASGDWAMLCNGDSPIVCNDDTNPASRLSGGAEAGINAAQADRKDVPRNAIINFDFSEAINVAELPLQTGITEDRVRVQYFDPTANAGAGAWLDAVGNLFHSNQYKTVEFIPDGECLDAQGAPIINSCGDKIYCLPVLDPNPYRPTHYRIVIKAGLLKTCATNADCVDANFNSCQATPGVDGDLVCQSGTGVNYPETAATPNGIIDAAKNSLNGNRNTQNITNPPLGRAEGPESQSGVGPYSLNTPADTDLGDDFIWSFWVNKGIDLTPPNLTDIGPSLGGSGVSLLLPVQSTFSEVMMSSTLKGGTNYKDGLCGCDPTENDGDNHNPDCEETEICDEILADFGKCKSETDTQNYCEKDNECNNEQCINKKYVSLIDNSAFPVGFWVTKAELDTMPPLDGWSDQTQARINHSRFLEVTNYGAEIGSGVQDAFQNCYKPSAGPGEPNVINECFVAKTSCIRDADCPVADRCVSVCLAADPDSCCEPPAGNPDKVYCCEGNPLNQGEWETSTCFSGY